MTIVRAYRYRCSLLDAILRANTIRSKSVYLASPSINILLTKYTSLCLSPSFIHAKFMLIVAAEVARYK